MDTRRQKIRQNPASSMESRGEAPTAMGRGTEVSVASYAPESPASSEYLMEEVCRRGNLKKALQRVRRNKGCPGIDGMTVDDLPEYLKEHWSDIRAELQNGIYKPQPVKRVEIEKPGGGVRKLGIPTVLDRFIQQALLQVLQKLWDPTFSEHSFGFRPRQSAHQAVRRAQEYIAQGYRWVNAGLRLGKRGVNAGSTQG